ncbi:MAG TPA: 23S rRNA (guanosine(2251)-2'-O)-methyltransferase RlmB [candidate division WWE3 bacterium]|uniref:23S rRNA (Guanosine(2251)-2'-O)-methyltransferase RlmB n=1 Tax=candidate division WWE3 bacterium TaxID=2053526 RepID=A0A7V5J052_UNCKA|nr:23S rRNA (guanosine(2251)-2'-O)-methyltransferase RlmB [candidate division WWE3 bacterium]
MQKRNLVFVEGLNPVLELFNSNRYIKKIYLDKGLKSPKKKNILEYASKRNIPIEYYSRSRLDTLSKTGVHQGVIALAERVVFSSLKGFLEDTLDKPNLSIVIARNITYEHNLGAIIRTCVASGVDGLIITGKSSVKITPVVERTSMGAISEIALFRESFFSAVKLLKRAGLKLIALEVTGEKYYFEESLTGRTAFVIGGESETLRENVINKVDTVVKIPMISKIPSLNVSVALGIVLYDRIRQLYGNTI